MPRNPFHHLYVGERVSAKEFTDIFSTELVQHAMPLFNAGHVVLSGANGMGKSMLFKLFDPDVRLAYAEAGKRFPVPEGAHLFVGAGINVNTARCNEFGNRRTPEGENIQELMFGDFLNYFVVLDMLRSLETLAASPAVAAQLAISFDHGRRADLSERVSRDPVWEGYLDGATGYDGLKSEMERRIHLYRRFMNGNDRTLDPGLADTKTAAGEPMKAMVGHLRASGAVLPEMPFFILIDQYEELATISGPDRHKADYRSVVNKILNNRDPTLSYRIGTRGYGWRDHLNIFGTDAQLEQERDFKLIELEARLRKSENGRTSVFPQFAKDVFRRRVLHSGDGGLQTAEVISDMVGRSPPPTEEARMLTGTDRAARRSVLELPEEWPDDVRQSLLTLAEENPLSARLGEAWVRQKGLGSLSPPSDRPWELKPYWMKERNEVALLQIAGRRRSRAVLAGEEDLIALSGGNILVFLSICQFIWDTAAQASRKEDGLPETPIKWELQTIGAIRAGRTWLDRITSEYGRSLDRYRLVQKLGERFAELLLPDRQLSNPGQCGISLSDEELRAEPGIRRFLIEAVDYGNLVMTEHANRNGRTRRLKFYLNPLYCPVYRVPFQRIKEPLYLSMKDFKSWLADAGVIERSATPRQPKPAPELPLLDLLDR